jgi:hypothetical protein
MPDHPDALIAVNQRAIIPPDGDAGAEEIIEPAQGGVTANLLGCLVDRDFIALYRLRRSQEE